MRGRLSSSSCSLSGPFELGALLTSSPQTPYILGPDGKLVREGETDIEENKEEGVEMEESKDSDDITPSSSSTPNMVMSSSVRDT